MYIDLKNRQPLKNNLEIVSGSVDFKFRFNKKH